MSSVEGKKRRKPATVLHATSVNNVLRLGAASAINNRTKRGNGVRLTAAAVEEATIAAERYLAQLAKKCQEILELQKKKTVDRKLLISVVEMLGCCRFKGSVQLIEKATKPGGGRKGSKEHPVRMARQPIAIASTVAAFNKGIVGGKVRISEEAKFALSELVRGYILRLGEYAAGYTNAGRRSTVTAGDVASAKSCMGSE